MNLTNKKSQLFLIQLGFYKYISFHHACTDSVASSFCILIFNSSRMRRARSSTVVSSIITKPPSGPGSKCIPTLLPSLKLCPPKKFHTVSTCKPSSSAILCMLPLGNESLILRSSLNVIVLMSHKFNG